MKNFITSKSKSKQFLEKKKKNSYLLGTFIHSDRVKKGNDIINDSYQSMITLLGQDLMIYVSDID